MTEKVLLVPVAWTGTISAILTTGTISMTRTLLGLEVFAYLIVVSTILSTRIIQCWEYVRIVELAAFLAIIKMDVRTGPS